MHLNSCTVLFLCSNIWYFFFAVTLLYTYMHIYFNIINWDYNFALLYALNAVSSRPLFSGVLNRRFSPKQPGSGVMESPHTMSTPKLKKTQSAPTPVHPVPSSDAQTPSAYTEPQVRPVQRQWISILFSKLEPLVKTQYVYMLQVKCSHSILFSLKTNTYN